jgi:hypothetical protein
MGLSCFGMGLTKPKFQKIIVSKEFEVKNGVLGLDRDVYLRKKSKRFRNNFLHLILFCFSFIFSG